ncbi:hypothetical protein J31TS4_34830 [Paenibacillus sp. J31TS4]|uniref:hypothetical protein n=1 Tax=Paenibacillus sp. J31TS4 TaxID=2807195 RepID=UPI001B2334A1|nr:hypothetical protein [Paenibacillus sp. J31TS4]GIP40203.1 hypothetical protein J31TS4_34830 [Paenibacillus sp. J31TS4]
MYAGWSMWIGKLRPAGRENEVRLFGRRAREYAFGAGQSGRPRQGNEFARPPLDENYVPIVRAVPIR